MKYKRSGDHYLHACKEVKGKIIKHNGDFTFGVGEAHNHNHRIVVDRPEDLIIRQDEHGYYFELLSDGKLLHTEGNSAKTADHKTIPIKKGKYRQVHEREVDLFSQAVRRVQD